jgi:hypothetical protein
VKKPLSLRVHHCACGIGPVQRDLYSAFLAAFLDASDPDHLTPSCGQYVVPWQGAEDGQVLPRSMGIPRAGVRQRERQSDPPLEPAFVLRQGRLEAWTGM